MKREGYQHGAVRVNRNKLLRVAGNGNGDAAVTELVAGGVAYARAPSKPTNASRDTGGRCRRPRCAGCHQHPPPASTKARDKAKGARKLRASDVALNHRLVSWRVVSGAGDGPAATGGYNYRGASASAVLAHLAGGNSWHQEDEDDQDGADLEAAAPRGISDLYDLIVGLQAGAAPAPGGEEEDAHGTAAAAADTDEIEEQDAGITDDVDDEEEEDDDDADRYGVSAVELERRLHELLHQRNQERIEELEAALRRAEKRLFDKEMEASLWKDTAKMAFRHDRDHDDDDSDSP